MLNKLKFWNPNSGFIGGFILGTGIGVTIGILFRLYLKSQQ